jgi:2-dehydropantoate 2-reductase
MPRIAVLGLGGIGGSIAAYLARAGQDVTMIDQWAEHVMAIRRNGLRLTDVNQEFTVPARPLHLCEVSGIREPFDTVFLSVKSYDTAWCTHLIAPYLKPSGCILPAMNGLNDETVAQIVGYPRTVGCVATISAGVYEPGHVVRTDTTRGPAFTVGELSGAITPRVQWTAEALQTLGPSEATPNIWGARWSKMIWNCMGNALAGLVGPATTPLSAQERERLSLLSVVTGSEAARVALQTGVVLEPVNGLHFQEFAAAATRDDFLALKAKLDVARGQIGLTPEQVRRLGVPGRPSLLQDVIKGRRTEVDYLNGVIVRMAAALGLPTPLNQAIVELMHAVEAQQVEPQADNLERLAPYLPF